MSFVCSVNGGPFALCWYFMHSYSNSLILFSFQAFTEGITNQLIGCFVGSLQEPDCVLVRLYGRMTELYVNRDQEVEMFQVFHAHGCAPEIYCSFQNGICYEFVRGTVLDDELLRQPSIYRSLQQELFKRFLKSSEVI